jgi:hypothetical protein
MKICKSARATVETARRQAARSRVAISFAIPVFLSQHELQVREISSAQRRRGMAKKNELKTTTKDKKNDESFHTNDGIGQKTLENATFVEQSI